VFRSEPNDVPDSDCAYDASKPAYETLSSNVTSYAFESVSTSLHFPLSWTFSRTGPVTPVRILVILRNTSASDTAAFLNPVSTKSQDEGAYAPGAFFQRIACRRQSLIQVLDDRVMQVAFTFMYESSGQKLSASHELSIAQEMNSVVDNFNTTCAPYFW
jgi:hypothetical protein